MKKRGIQQKGMINIELYTIQDLIDIIIELDPKYSKIVSESQKIPMLLERTYVELLLWATSLKPVKNIN